MKTFRLKKRFNISDIRIQSIQMFVLFHGGKEITFAQNFQTLGGKAIINPGQKSWGGVYTYKG